MATARPHFARAVFTAVLGFVLLAAASIALVRMLQGVTITRLLGDLRAIPETQLLLAIGVTLATYLAMSGYDLLGLRYAGVRLPLGRVVAAAFVGDAFNNSLGLSAVIGTSVRYRFYSAWGLSNGQIAKTVGVFTVSYWVGFVLLCGLLLTAGLSSAGGILALPVSTGRVMGILLLAGAAVCLAALFLRRRPLQLLRWRLEMPSAGVAIGLLVIAILDWVLAATVFYMLLPQGSGVPYMSFVAVYVIAHLAGMLSQLPGGIVVFEAVSLTTLLPVMPASQAMAAIVAFRAVFYLLPLFMALVVMAAMETMHLRQILRS